MELYVVIIEDRQLDVKVMPYSDKDTAIKVAKKLAKTFCVDQDDYEEHDYGRDVGWLFYANYSSEGESVRVVTTTLDEEI